MSTWIHRLAILDNAQCRPFSGPKGMQGGSPSIRTICGKTTAKSTENDLFDASSCSLLDSYHFERRR